MLDKKLFTKLSKEYESYDVSRRIIIKHSNEILRLSKQVIFSLHRDKMTEVQKNIKEAEDTLEYLQTKVIKKEPTMKYEGIYLAAVEEFVEAMLFYQFIKTGKITEIKGYEFNVATYLGGLSDFTGEMVRRGIYYATKRKYKDVEKCKNIIEEVVAELLKMNMLGKLRYKFDQSKNNLRKIEEIMYDLELKRRN